MKPISADDLHKAADSELMNPQTPDGINKEVAHGIQEEMGFEPDAILDFLNSSNFRFPNAAGLPDPLNARSIAYGLTLGITAYREKLDQES